ncbi:LysR family transcriptional regulator [Thioclava sp. BHET1]|nr:LysR family transcriptional regulator [Thioclava sp. BHET1]
MDELTALSLRRLRQFLIVAETLHMARAAEQIGIAQPALSQQIRALEEGLGVRLFHRRKRGIELTAAGESYRQSAARLIASHHEAAERARLMARGELGRIVVGHVPSALFSPSFPQLLRRLADDLPDVELHLREGLIRDLSRDVITGQIDIALLRAPVAAQSDLAQLALPEQRLLVAVPRQHPLARKASVGVTDLVGLPLVGYSDPTDVGIMQIVNRVADRAGVSLTLRWSVSTMTGILGLVAEGFGYGIVPAGLEAFGPQTLAFVPLSEEGATAGLCYVWRREDISPALARFLSLARAI